MLPARRRWWRMSPRMSSVLRPTRSRPRMRRPAEAREIVPAGSSAVGSANSSRMRFANLSWRISGCETRSAGRYSTVERVTACLLYTSKLSLLLPLPGSVSTSLVRSGCLAHVAHPAVDILPAFVEGHDLLGVQLQTGGDDHGIGKL